MKRGEGKKASETKGKDKVEMKGAEREAKTKNRVSWDNDLVLGKPHKIKGFWVLTTPPVWWLELRSGDTKTIWDIVKTIFNYRKCIFHIVIFKIKSDLTGIACALDGLFFAYNRKKKVFEKIAILVLTKMIGSDTIQMSDGQGNKPETIESVGIAVIWFGQ